MSNFENTVTISVPKLNARTITPDNFVNMFFMALRDKLIKAGGDIYDEMEFSTFQYVLMKSMPTIATHARAGLLLRKFMDSYAEPLSLNDDTRLNVAIVWCDLCDMNDEVIPIEILNYVNTVTYDFHTDVPEYNMHDGYEWYDKISGEE